MNFSFTHIADLHIGSYRSKEEAGGINSRLLDFIKTYNEVIDFTIDSKSDLLLIPGDIFRNKYPAPFDLDSFVTGIKRVVDKGIQVVTLVGNHDSFESDVLKNSIACMSTLGLNNFITSSVPEIIKIKVKGQDLQIQTMPYPRRSLLRMKTNQEVEEYVIKTINDVYEKRDKKVPIIFAGHFTIKDMQTGGEQMSVNKFTEPVIPKSALEGKDYLYGAMGHLHKFQKVMDNPPTFYTGSTNRCDFNEAKEEKGFIHVKVDGKNVDAKFVKVNARKFVDIACDLSDSASPQEDMLKELNARLEEIKDAVVRVQITLSESNRSLYDPIAISSFLQKYVNDINGSCTPYIKRTKQRIETKFRESMSSMDAIVEYSKIRMKTDSDRKLFLRFGEEIIKKVKGENNEV